MMETVRKQEMRTPEGPARVLASPLIRLAVISLSRAGTMSDSIPGVSSQNCVCSVPSVSPAPAYAWHVMGGQYPHRICRMNA